MEGDNHMHWIEGLADPEHRERTEKIIDIILMRSCEFVCTIDVKASTVNFRFMSEGIHRVAPHWKQNEDMDFDTNMCGSLAELVREDFRDEMLRTFRIPYIVERLEEESPYITTFSLVVGENKVLRKQIQYYWLDDNEEEILCIQSDVSVAYERERYNERLKKEASTDPLTGLPNRRGIRFALDDLAMRNSSKGEPFSVAMCDIDFFKKVNDTYGHDAGDVVLTSVADCFTEFMEGRGSVGRMGGEEFLIAFENCRPDDAAVLLNELREKIAAMVVMHGDDTIRITMTFGVVGYDPLAGVHEAVNGADACLYYGKNNGRNRVVTEAELDQAIEAE